jgi:hypothetical protein
MIMLLVALLVADAVALVWLASRRAFSPMLTIALALTFIFWWVSPVVTTLGGWQHVAPRAYASRDDFCRVAVLEAGSFLTILLILGLSRLTFASITRSVVAQVRFTPRMLTLLIVAAVAVDLILRQIEWSIVGATYWDANAFAVRSEGTADAANLGVVAFVEFLVRAFLYACAVTRTERQSRIVTLVLWSGILVGAAQEVLVGSRFALLNGVIVGLMRLHLGRISRSAMVFWYAAFGLFLSTVGVVVALAVVSMRGDATVTVESTREASREVEARPLTERGWLVFDQINMKFDAITMGARLLRSFGAGSGGWRPYHGAVLAIVPRQFVPLKPVPSSADGTNLGVPPRLVAGDIGFEPEIGTVNISPAAISMWELGWVGVALFVFLNVLQLRLINSLLMGPSLPSRTLGLVLVGIPTFGGLIAPGDIVIMNVERTLLIYLVLAAVFSVLAVISSGRTSTVTA